MDDLLELNEQVLAVDIPDEVLERAANDEKGAFRRSALFWEIHSKQDAIEWIAAHSWLTAPAADGSQSPK